MCRRLLLLRTDNKSLISRRKLSGVVSDGIIKGSGKNSLVASKLESRSLVRVSGSEAMGFLQGLITNDVHHLETKPAIYTLFLNHQGRVLYDAILYATEKPDEALIECDSKIKTLLMKHLSIYRVRKKVEISDANSELKQDVWVIYDVNHKKKYAKCSNNK